MSKLITFIKCGKLVWDRFSMNKEITHLSKSSEKTSPEVAVPQIEWANEPFSFFFLGISWKYFVNLEKRPYSDFSINGCDYLRVICVNYGSSNPRFLDLFTNVISKAEKTDDKTFYGSKVLSGCCLRNNRPKKMLVLFIFPVLQIQMIIPIGYLYKEFVLLLP